MFSRLATTTQRMSFNTWAAAPPAEALLNTYLAILPDFPNSNRSAFRFVCIPSHTGSFRDVMTDSPYDPPTSRTPA